MADGGGGRTLSGRDSGARRGRLYPQPDSGGSGTDVGWLLAGGIVYTIGAVIFGIGSKVRWMHSVFHIFVVAGSVLQAVAVIWYVL